MSDLNILKDFSTEGFSNSNSDILSQFSKQAENFNELSELLEKINKGIKDFKDEFGIYSEEDYKGIGGFFKRMGKIKKDMKKKIDEVKDFFKKRKKIIIAGIIILGLVIAGMILIPRFL